MSAVNELASQMDAMWDKDTKKIIEEVSEDDYYNDFRKDGENVEDHIANRFSEFLPHFQNNAQDDGDKLIIYRCISPDDEDEFLFHIAHGEPIEGHEGLGIFWSYDREKAGCHWGSGSSHQSSGDVVVEALVSVNDIDVYRTLILNLNPSLGAEEAEIRVKEGAKLEVLGVHTSDNEYISPLDEGLEPIPMHASFYKTYPALARVLFEIKKGTK